MCDHPAPIPHATCYTLADPESGAILYSVHVHVFCPVCQTKFRFLGRNAAVPATAMQALMEGTGAFVAADGLELGVLVAPDVLPGEDLLNAQPMGRA